MAPRNMKYQKKPHIEEHVKIHIHTMVDYFVRDESQTKMACPMSLDNVQRAYIHQHVAGMGLISKSYGKGEF